MKGYLVIHRESGKPISGSRSGFYSTIGAAKHARLWTVKWHRAPNIDKHDLARQLYKIVEVTVDEMREIEE